MKLEDLIAEYEEIMGIKLTDREKIIFGYALMVGKMEAQGGKVPSQKADTMNTKMEVSDTDVLEALILALDYLEYQGDFTLGYSTPAQSLRDAANRMEQKERDIDHINYIIEELRIRIERRKWQE